MSRRQSVHGYVAGAVFSASAAPDASNLFASSISVAILRAASAIGIPPRWMFEITVRSGSIDLRVGPVNQVCAQAFGGDEAGALADDHADDVGAENFAEMIFDSDASVANEDWLQELVARREYPGERAQQRRRHFSRPQPMKVRRRCIAGLWAGRFALPPGDLTPNPFRRGKGDRIRARLEARDASCVGIG